MESNIGAAHLESEHEGGPAAMPLWSSAIPTLCVRYPLYAHALLQPHPHPILLLSSPTPKCVVFTLHLANVPSSLLQLLSNIPSSSVCVLQFNSFPAPIPTPTLCCWGHPLRHRALRAPTVFSSLDKCNICPANENKEYELKP